MQMKRKQKRMFRKVAGMMLALILMLGNFSGIKAYAEESGKVASAQEIEVLKAELIEEYLTTPGVNARTVLTDCIISVSQINDAMHIECHTSSFGMASVLGVKDIVIMKKVWYGWKTVATSSGGEVQNRSMMGVTVEYANAEVGETYRITCVHYGDVDGYHELENDTGAFVFDF